MKKINCNTVMKVMFPRSKGLSLVMVLTLILISHESHGKLLSVYCNPIEAGKPYLEVENISDGLQIPGASRDNFARVSASIVTYDSKFARSILNERETLGCIYEFKTANNNRRFIQNCSYGHLASEDRLILEITNQKNELGWFFSKFNPGYGDSWNNYFCKEKL